MTINTNGFTHPECKNGAGIPLKSQDGQFSIDTIGKLYKDERKALSYFDCRYRDNLHIEDFSQPTGGEGRIINGCAGAGKSM